MAPITVAAQRMSVRDYHLNRGRFLPTEPALSLLLSVPGAVNRSQGIEWSDMADPDWALWDARAAEEFWVSVPVSMRLELVGGGSALTEVVDGVQRGCGGTMSGARIATGGTFSAVVPQDRRAWMVMAFDVVSPEQNGVIASVRTLAGKLSIHKTANVYVYSLDDTRLGIRPRALSRSMPAVLGIQVSEGYLVIRMWDDTGNSTMRLISASDMMIPSSIEVGGPGSPDMMVYMVGFGTGDDAGSVMEMVRGHMSC